MKVTVPTLMVLNSGDQAAQGLSGSLKTEALLSLLTYIQKPFLLTDATLATSNSNSALASRAFSLHLALGGHKTFPRRIPDCLSQKTFSPTSFRHSPDLLVTAVCWSQLMPGKSKSPRRTRATGPELSPHGLWKNSAALAAWLGRREQTPTTRAALFAIPLVLTQRLSTTALAHRKGRTIQPLPDTQCDTSTSPTPPEQPGASTPALPAWHSSHQVPRIPRTCQLWGRSEASSQRHLHSQPPRAAGRGRGHPSPP